MVFPNYPLLKECYQVWKNLFERQCFEETRQLGLISSSLFEKYKYLCKETEGAILFCVHRGKYTEGYNFEN